MAEDSRTLSAMFEDAELQRLRLEESGFSNSQSFQDQLATVLSLYHACIQLIERGSIFSLNEELDDVGTSELPFMLVHYHVAELKTRIYAETANRKDILISSRRDYEAFLELIDRHEGLNKQDARVFERFREDRDRFEVIEGGSADAARKRQGKIERFRTEKDLKSKLNGLRSNPRALEENEEIARSLRLTELQYYVHQAFQHLESIAQELQVLSLAPASGTRPTEDANGAQADLRLNQNGGDDYSDRLDSSDALRNPRGGPILDSSGRPLRPFTLLDTRQRLQDGVFRPDYNLPTMTIDEYLDEEKKRGGFIPKGEGGEASLRRSEKTWEELDGDAEAERKQDEEQVKNRAWDDWKDENPRGAGNTMNMG